MQAGYKPFLIFVLVVLLMAYGAAQSQKFSVPASVTVNVNSLVPQLSVSNTLLDAGQYTLLTANAPAASSGPPYSYSYSITNSVTGALLANQLYSNVLSSSNSFLWEPPSYLLGNSLRANVVVTDSNSVSYASQYLLIGFNSLLSASMSLSPTLNVHAGKYEVLSANALGGTPPYTYSFHVVNSIDNSLLAVSSGSSNAFSWNIPSEYAGNTFRANVVITDSATTPESAPSPYSARGLINPIISKSNDVSAGISISSTSFAIISAESMGTNVTLSSNIPTNATVEVKNVTQYIAVPPPQGLQKISIINFSASNMGNSIVYASFATAYNCSQSSSGISVYELEGGIWKQMSYAVNGSSCTVNYSVAADPTIGIFTLGTFKASVAPTGPASTGGGGGGGGGGGIEQPAISKTSAGCYVIRNVTQLGTFNLALGSERARVVENFISPTQAGISINGASMLLQPNETYSIASMQNSTVSLLNISYLPIEDTIELEMCGPPSAESQGVAFSYIPVYVTLPEGGSLLSQLVISNSGKQAETVNLSAGGYGSMLSLPESSISINPGSSVSMQVLFNDSHGIGPGRYTIAFNMTAVSSAGLVSKTTEYITLEIAPAQPSGLTYTDQLDLLNSSREATGILQLTAPPNGSISNIIVKTTIPPQVANSLSEITAYGIENNKTLENGTYAIDWRVDYIPAGQSVYAYYAIARPENTSDLNQISQGFILPVSNGPNRILKVINIDIPTFYSNSTNRLTIYALYTGNSTSKVSFDLLTSSNATIPDSEQSFLVQPDHYVNASFYVITGEEPGTLAMNLSVETQGESIYYPLSVIVFPKPQTTITFPTTVRQPGYQAIPFAYVVEALSFMALVVALLLAISALAHRLRPRRRRRRVRAKH